MPDSTIEFKTFATQNSGKKCNDFFPTTEMVKYVHLNSKATLQLCAAFVRFLCCSPAPLTFRADCYKKQVKKHLPVKLQFSCVRVGTLATIHPQDDDDDKH